MDPPIKNNSLVVELTNFEKTHELSKESTEKLYTLIHNSLQKGYNSAQQRSSGSNTTSQHEIIQNYLSKKLCE